MYAHALRVQRMAEAVEEQLKHAKSKEEADRIISFALSGISKNDPDREYIFAAVNRGIVPGVYHFSNEGVCSWYDFTLAIHRLAGIKTCKVTPLHTDEFPAKAPRPYYSVLDKTKIKKTFGIDIPHWEESLAVCIENLEK